jgi:leucyl aminopeptidase
LTPDPVSPVEYQGWTAAPETVRTDLLVVPVFGAADQLADVPWLDVATGDAVRRARESGEFRTKTYETLVVSATGTACQAQRVVMVGAGPEVEADAERLRRVGAIGGYVARRCAAESVAVLVRGGIDALQAARHLADGLAGTEFDGAAYKRAEGTPRRPLVRAVVVAPGAASGALAAAVERGRVVAQCANFGRGLANEPANVLTPTEFAARVGTAARAAGLEVDVLDETRIRDLDMRLLLAVAQGSDEPPRVIVLRHRPAKAPGAAPVLALVGKGVTFDTGGISIKPADGMERMKDDMAGGAAVAAAMLAIAKLGGPFQVIGVIPTTENMPGGRATRPGDVIRGANGKTVEIINTDAEGRLILADALWYAQQLGATHMVDVATLTGACMVALGRNVSGLFGQSEAWVETVRSAAARAGDRVWPMPIYEEVRDQLRSEIADMVNSAGRPGGASTAAGFLREFAGDGPWAHLDIAGTAWAETKEPYQPKGATGVAVRVLTELGMSGGR